MQTKHCCLYYTVVNLKMEACWLKKSNNWKKLVKVTKKIINKLLNNEILESKYKDHKLIGKYAGFRECHIKPDLLLIYKKENNALILVCIAIVSHSDLF